MHTYLYLTVFLAGLTSLRCRRTSEPMPIPARSTFIRTETPAAGDQVTASEQKSTSVLIHHVEVLQVELLPHPGVISEIIHGKAHHL